jgi:hypothetical protein
LTAQWPRREKPGLPKHADGTVNLNAPAPRTPEGTPDFSGVWVLAGGGGRGRGAAAAPAPPPADAPALSQFFEVGGRGNPLPLQPWAAELKKKRMAANSIRV